LAVFSIHDGLECYRLLQGQIARLRTIEDLGHIGRGALVIVADPIPVTRQPARLDIQRASEHRGHHTLSSEGTRDDACGADCANAAAHLNRLRAVLPVRSRRGRRRSNSGFALRVDHDRSTRWRRHLHTMFIATEVVCNIPIVHAR